MTRFAHIPALRIFAGTTLVVGMAGAASASLLASESFEVGPGADTNDADGIYETDATIVGTSPDTFGFAAEATWNLATGASTSIAQADGLALTGVANSGGSVTFTQTGGTGTGSSTVSRGLDTDTTGVTGNTFFASFLIERSDVSAGSNRTELNFTRNGTGSAGTGPLSIGLDDDELSLLYNTFDSSGNTTLLSSDSGSGLDLAANTTYFLVLEVEADGGTAAGADRVVARLFKEGDTIEIGGESGSLVGLDADVFNPTDGSFAAVQPRTAAGGYTVDETFTFDEIRVGTTFDSVVPEPGSLALIGLGSVLALTRRRTAS
ncbi:MAG: PEP-CTERM sorting domain-containing protein [Planctomycetota bacterium]